MESIMGTCMYCGQTRMVEAATQEEADRIAAEECTCGNKSKSIRKCKDNIEQICGPSAQNFGMDILSNETIDVLKDVGELCVLEAIGTATFRLPDSTVAIKQTKDGVSVSRKKVLSVKVEE